MFIDTSVVVALLAGEPDAARFAARIARAETSTTSGLVVLEASMRLSSLLGLDPVLVETRIQTLLAEARIIIVPIDALVAKQAVAAFAAYGKGRGHPAQLNLADCMSYACARAHRVPLLKGELFTDGYRGGVGRGSPWTRRVDPGRCDRRWSAELIGTWTRRR